MSAGDPVSDADFVTIQRFLHHEAALLDGREFRAWFDLLTEDIDYRITAQVTRNTAAGMEEYAIVDEDADALRLRVEQIADHRLTHAENPPSLTRRFVSNIVAHDAAPPDAFVVETNLLVYRSRTTAPEGGFYVGQRRDVLRRANDGLRIAARRVRLDQTILQNGSLSTPL